MDCSQRCFEFDLRPILSFQIVVLMTIHRTRCHLARPVAVAPNLRKRSLLLPVRLLPMPDSALLTNQRCLLLLLVLVVLPIHHCLPLAPAVLPMHHC